MTVTLYHLTGWAGAIKMKRAIVGLLMAGLFSCVGANASADEITITSGTVDVAAASAGNVAAPFDLMGSGFEISGSASGTLQTTCFPCSGGPLGTGVGISWSGPDFGNGPATVAGHNYGNVFFDGSFAAVGNAMLPIVASGPFTVAFPFAIASGSHVSGFSDGVRNNQLFNTNLTGSGVATASFAPDPASPTTLFDIRSLKLNFQSSAAPTPEPMSVLLVVSGLGVVARQLVRKSN
jgi:hypothetical protein